MSCNLSGPPADPSVAARAGMVCLSNVLFFFMTPYVFFVDTWLHTFVDMFPCVLIVGMCGSMCCFDCRHDAPMCF